MELLTLGFGVAVALGTLLLEKTGEKVAEKGIEVVWDKTAKLVTSIKQESPDTATAMERFAEQPLDYGEAELLDVVQKVQSVAAAHPDVAGYIQSVADAAEANPHPKFEEIFGKIEEALKSQQPSIYNDNKAKLQEKGIINQGVIQRQDVSF